MSEPAAHRRGAPSPLILHLASALSLYETGARLAPIANQPRFPWATPPDREQLALAAAIAAAPNPFMGLALRAEIAERLAVMEKGIRLYQRHPARRVAPDYPVLWSEGGSRLLDCGPVGARPVFIVPSLVNRPYILDLAPGTSLVEALRSAGMRPLMLDWGTPGPAEQALDLTGYTQTRLAPAFAAGLAATGAATMPLVGYCMGGTMSVALAEHPDIPVSRLALLGAPWDFAAMTPMRAALASLGLTGRRADLEKTLDGVAAIFGAIPVGALQMVFALLDPGLAARKFGRFARMDQTGEAARHFVLIEDWLNDGPPLTGPAARQALIDWQAENQTMRGQWRLFDRPVDAARVACPTLVIAARGDRISTPGATTPLARIIPDARLVEPATGHVGMIVGSAAPAQIWGPLARFLT